MASEVEIRLTLEAAERTEKMVAMVCVGVGVLLLAAAKAARSALGWSEADVATLVACRNGLHLAAQKANARYK